jgi:predicted kinase
VTPISTFMPTGPSWSLDWDGIDAAYPWIQDLRGCPHDPIHHREGDVWRHVQMVVSAMVEDHEWRALPDDLRLAAFAAALLHDVAKPATASEETVDGIVRVHHHGHSRVGATMARGILWREGFPPRLREVVCAVIARHQVPFWLHEREYEDARRIVAGQSLSSGNRLLTMLARADARGRICDDRDMMEYAVEEYARIADGHGCLDAPFAFAGDRERFLYLSRRAELDPRFPLHDPGDRPELTVMSALPGAGKTTWIARNAPGLPVVSLDEIRRRLRLAPDEAKGQVLPIAYEEARVLARTKQPFVWDATGLIRDLRSKIVDLGFRYGYSVRIVALEAPVEVVRKRNREREHPVPWEAVERMVDKWDMPDLSECDVLVAPALAGAEPEPAAGPALRP